MYCAWTHAQYILYYLLYKIK